ncbi:MAG: sodium:proton antiporter [candidate division Zixibacteria bacterium]|nr:sodium:proton antiporter [candidate division Zixibacteria bacterium]
MRNYRFRLTLLIILLSLFIPLAAQASDAEGITTLPEAEHTDIGSELPLWSIIPFVGILLSIAILPLLAPVFWEHHFPKISFAWALVFAIPFLFFYRVDAIHEIVHIYIIDYIPFIILLWGLFTASGGILVRGTMAGSPKVNLTFLIIGTILASWMGTTGASMLLIRPLIRANRKRNYKMHTIIFFIFLVSNIGGSLTPLGDPPLFLGFLHGVPFFWTFNLFPHMSVLALMLFAIYYVVDMILYKKETRQIENENPEPIKVEGIHNLIFLAGIMGAVLLSGVWEAGEMNVLGIHVGIQNITRDVLIVAMGLFSLWTTSKKIRSDNEFTWFPIKEVAYLFAGIFMTIIPALAMLKAGTHGPLGFIVEIVREPSHYFWITGSLSAFLDNAPTYLTFYNLAEGRLGIADADVASILNGALNGNYAVFIDYLKAISAGAVFFGAVTYIGNAPNFMVRSISEESKIKMPSFFGYMLWSVGILVPLFILITLIFFR